MTIETTTIEQYGEAQWLEMSPQATLQDTIEQAKVKQYAENQAYLVVRLAEKEAIAMLFTDLLPQVIRPLGYDSLISPLKSLPLARADLVVRTDIPQSGLEVIDWVAARPQSTAVVIDNSGVVGLFVNPNRSGFFDSLLSLFGLHDNVLASSDPHQTFAQSAPPAPCPVCRKADYAKYKASDDLYYCRHCSHKQQGGSW